MGEGRPPPAECSEVEQPLLDLAQVTDLEGNHHSARQDLVSDIVAPV